MNNNIISIQSLSHRYATDWAIKDINLDISKNGILGLLGSNGAGKSTTMNIMCGVLNQTHGTVLIDGIDIRKNPVAAKKKIGFLPQQVPLYLDNTIDEYLLHCAHLRQVSPQYISAALDTVKTKCGLQDISRRLIKNLSGGYKQRVGIAGAIIHDPKVVVLDEPTVGLDPVQVVEVRKIIQEIGKDRAVIFSTHIMSEVQALCQDIKMIEHGRLVFSGTVSEFNNYIKPNTISLSFKSCPDAEKIKKIEGVTDVKKVDEQTMKVKFDLSQDVTENIIEASVHNQWGLREVTLERVALEKVFTQMTKDLHTKGGENK